MRRWRSEFLTLSMALMTMCSVRSQENNVEPPLDAQAQQFVRALAESNTPGFHELPPAEGRKAFAGLKSLFGSAPNDVASEDRQFGSVPVRVYKPVGTNASVLPAVVYFHGGGWVLGSIATHDALCRRLCSESRAAVVSVDYRLAPEHPYPLPFNDCYQALTFALDHAAELGLDAKRIVVGGDSAGGNLACAVALKARDTSGPKILAQLLIYPALDSDCNSRSYDAYASGFGLTKDAMKWYWKQYVGARVADAYSSPAKAESLGGLPETIVITAQYDVLRDEGEAFSKKLQAAGVKVTHRRYDGTIHGFVHFAGVFDQGLVATTDIAKQLRRIFGTP